MSKSQKKLKKLDITIEKIITIKLMNGLDSLFKTYLIMLNQKAKDENKLYDLQAFILNLKEKKQHIKWTIKVNFT